MKYKIIADSCCEFPSEWIGDPRFERIALGLDVDGVVTMDDENFVQKDFLNMVANSKACPKSFCPSPGAYAEAFEGDADNIFVFTLSAQLSGSYNSAVAARRMYNSDRKAEGLPKKNIFICDSKSASGGETQLALMAYSLCEQGLFFSDICMKLMFKRNQMRTYFVLDNLDTLKKNGRITGLTAALIEAINIKPVMAAMNGEIVQHGKAIGTKRALGAMVEAIISDVKNPKNRTVIISHCNAYERALEIKDEMLKHCNFKNIIIMDTRGVSSMYANDGGVIVTV